MTVEKSRGMIGSAKPFDKAEHDIYDPLGKSAMMGFLNKKLGKKFQLTTIENPNKHGIDLLSLNKNGEVSHCWENEVRHGNWQGNVPFPFGDINCIERKDHQWRKEQSFVKNIPFKLSDNLKVYYVQLNKECTRGVIIDGDTVLKYDLKPWKNRKFDNECVRQVPVKEAVEIVIED